MSAKIIVIDGYIGPFGYSKQFIRNELAGQSKNPVTIKISSLGGSVDDALNIYDQFVEHGNVTAELSAFVASSATLVSLGAKTVRMNENSFYLIHKAMNWVDEWGTMNEDEIESLIAKLEAQKQQLAKITLQLAKMYVKKTGKTLDEIINLMKQETWLTAEEAKTWGFIDEVFAPDVAVNYLDNLQMVAMITSNGFPDPPRKVIKRNPVAEPAEAPVAELAEAFFERIWNRLLNKQKEVTPKNKKVEMKKQFIHLNTVLSVDALEGTDEGVFLNEEQLRLIEERLEASVDRKDWPFVKWLIEVYYARQIDQDMELNEYYKGVYAAPIAGTAGADGTGMNGLQKQLQAGVDALKINSINLGALDKTTIFDQVESFTDSIAEVYQGIKMNVFMSRYWYKKYMQDKRAQGFYQRTSDKDIDGKIDFTPLDVKPLACMVGTDDIFCTPVENFIHISPATLTKNQFKLEEAKRSVAVMADWSEGLGFGINEAVWTNIRPTV